MFLLKQTFDNVYNALYPPHCLFCGEIMCVNQWHTVFCNTCKEKVHYLPKSTCITCDSELNRGEVCTDCFEGNMYFYQAVGVFDYEQIREGIINFKFHNMRKSGVYFADLMSRFLRNNYYNWIDAVDYIVAVPMHKNKLKKRRYNQAEILAENISKCIDIPHNFNLIFKVSETTSQTRISDVSRNENIKDTFLANDCTGLTLILIDDVFTTGSTANECSKMLMNAGAKMVLVFTLAVA